MKRWGGDNPASLLLATSKLHLQLHLAHRFTYNLHCVQTQIAVQSAVMLPLAMPWNQKAKSMRRLRVRAYPRGRAFAFRVPPAYVHNYILSPPPI